MNAHARTVTAIVVTVTPMMAREWLGKNTRNRAFRRSHVGGLAAQMRRGDWKLTHQGIAFAPDGTLLDGQHRLAAIVAADVAVTMLVFWNWDADVFGVLDKGINRTIRDDLMGDGRLVEPATFLVRLMDKANRAKVMTADVRRMLDAIEPNLTAVRAASGAMVRGRTAAPTVAAVAMRYYEADASGRDYILTQWRAWVTLDLPAMSPSIAALLKRSDSIGTDRGSTTAHERAAIAWNAFNPRARNLSKILVRDLSGILDELREAVASATNQQKENAA
jgi:hypothetical protein